MSLAASTPLKHLHISPTVSGNVLRTICRGTLMGEGTFAAVWAYNGFALKVTRDPATIALAYQLMAAPVRGLPRIFSIEENVAMEGNDYFDGIVMELLTPLSAAQFAPIRRIYLECKATAEARYKRVRGQSVYAAQLMAERLPRLRSPVLGLGGPANMAAAMAWLATFMDNHEFCADFGHRRNWMMSATHGIVLSDPVVVRICYLDATSSDNFCS